MEAVRETENKEKAEARANAVDFKMVTFSLAGKDYGIDIMNVKEIAKAGKFTYVPNAASFLRGVYNLRGDIIPVIDLRTFFHLPAEKKEEDALESTLILRIDEHIFGVIVDNIDKVVGISSSSIQPPHPIFGDINIKYIRGVVENDSRLYIILDIVRIFSPNKEESASRPVESVTSAFSAPLASTVTQAEAFKASRGETGPALDLDFIKETLASFRGFFAADFNEQWVLRRFEEWKRSRKGGDLQLKEADEADNFLSTFFSIDSDRFWSDDYAAAVQAALPDMPSKNISVWNPGCGKGFETYSFACVLRRRYPDSRIKIWANDSDLLAISTAPNMVFEVMDMPEYCRDFLVKGKNGYSFNQAIKDSISFEYHDVKNANPFPDMDIIFARDLLSFLPSVDQVRLFGDFSDKLKDKGILFLGTNEKLSSDVDWKAVGSDSVSAYVRAE